MKLKQGLTLIELLVVISIISLLASITFAFVQEARNRSRVVKTKAELVQFGKALHLLYADTNALPGGCALGAGAPQGESPFIQAEEFGVLAPPPPSGDGLFGCEWSPQERDAWNGPYYSLAANSAPGSAYVDAWQRAIIYRNNSAPGSAPGSLLISLGPDVDDPNDNIIVLFTP